MLNVTLTDSDPVAHPHGSEEIVRYKTYPVLSPVSVHEGKEEKSWLLLQGIVDRVSVSEQIGKED